jgi:hypothetical protein
MGYDERGSLAQGLPEVMTGVDQIGNGVPDGDRIRSLVHQFLFVCRSDVCRYGDMAFFCTLPSVRDTPHAEPDILMDYLVAHCGWTEVGGWGRLLNRRTIRRP